MQQARVQNVNLTKTERAGQLVWVEADARSVFVQVRGRVF